MRNADLLGGCVVRVQCGYSEPSGTSGFESDDAFPNGMNAKNISTLYQKYLKGTIIAGPCLHRESKLFEGRFSAGLGDYE